MKHHIKIKPFVLLFFITLFIFGSKDKNYIDKYEVSLDSLKTLPNGFYAHRHGNIYFDNRKYMIWFTLNYFGDVKNIFRVTDLLNRNLSITRTISKYKIDTIEHKLLMQRF